MSMLVGASTGPYKHRCVGCQHQRSPCGRGSHGRTPCERVESPWQVYSVAPGFRRESKLRLRASENSRGINSVFSNTSPFPRVLGGLLEGRIPGKNGEATPEKMACHLLVGISRAQGNEPSQGTDSYFEKCPVGVPFLLTLRGEAMFLLFSLSTRDCIWQCPKSCLAYVYHAGC